MGWSIGFDSKHGGRDIGYGVPAICDHPECSKEIDRGLSYVCGGEPYGGDYGCGMFFCAEHLFYAGVRRENKQLCPRCLRSYYHPYKPKPDVPEWLYWKLNHESWQKWRDKNPEEATSIRNAWDALPTDVRELAEDVCYADMCDVLEKQP